MDGDQKHERVSQPLMDANECGKQIVVVMDEIGQRKEAKKRNWNASCRRHQPTRHWQSEHQTIKAKMDESGGDHLPIRQMFNQFRQDLSDTPAQTQNKQGEGQQPEFLVIENQRDLFRVEADIRKCGHIQSHRRKRDHEKRHQPMQHDRYRAITVFGVLNRGHRSHPIRQASCQPKSRCQMLGRWDRHDVTHFRPG